MSTDGRNGIGRDVGSTGVATGETAGKRRLVVGEGCGLASAGRGGRVGSLRRSGRTVWGCGGGLVGGKTFVGGMS